MGVRELCVWFVNVVVAEYVGAASRSVFEGEVCRSAAPVYYLTGCGVVY
jgi:hypothetical protein